jgi:hypothetical protein
VIPKPILHSQVPGHPESSDEAGHRFDFGGIESAEMRYRLDSEKLDVAFIPNDERTRSLVRTLNDAQSFTIVPEDRDTIYVHGSFYTPALKFGPDRFDPNMFHTGHCLYPSKKSGDTKKEKGKAITSDGGDGPKSLFGIIDSGRTASIRRS